MKQRIYYELGKGAWLASISQGNKWNGQGGQKTGRQMPVKVQVTRPKTTLDELVLKFVLSALIFYPELILQFEEKMSLFSFPNAELQKLFDTMLEIVNAHDGDEAFNSNVLCAELEEKGLKKLLNSLWELKMFRLQKPFESNLRRDIETKLAEVQIRQLEKEIKDILNKMENSSSFSEEDYSLYQSLKNERQALIDSNSSLD